MFNANLIICNAIYLYVSKNLMKHQLFIEYENKYEINMKMQKISNRITKISTFNNKCTIICARHCICIIKENNFD